MSTKSNRADSNRIQSYVSATDQGAVDYVHALQEPREEAHNTFLNVMRNMFNVFVKVNSVA